MFCGYFCLVQKFFLLFLGQQTKGLGQFVNFSRGGAPIIYILGKFSIFYVYIYILRIFTENLRGGGLSPNLVPSLKHSLMILSEFTRKFFCGD